MENQAGNYFGSKINWTTEMQDRTAETPKSAIAMWDNAGAPAEVTGTQGDVIYVGAGGVWDKLGAGTAGYVLKTGGAGANPSWGTVGTMVLGGFAANLNSTDNSFMALDMADMTTVGAMGRETTEYKCEIVVPMACTASNFYVNVPTGTNSLGAASSVTLTLRKNGADTAITVSYATGEEGAKSDVAHTVSIAAGDRICLSVVGAGAGGGGYAARWGLQLTG